MGSQTSRTKSLADRLFPIKGATDDSDIKEIPPEERRLHTETYDFTVGTIYDYLQNGDICIPEFQRLFVWNRSQASRLIESLVIQCPIPAIYLNQDRDEKLSVIDGNQRLQSIKLYMDDEFPLRGLTTYPELEGLFFSELDPRIIRHIRHRTLRCIAVLADTHPQIKFDVFERLNTGAVQLNPQEIRHGLYHGSLTQMLDDLSDQPVWKEISGLRNDKRMKGAELILRFIALKKDLQNYKKPLSDFLNNFCEKYQNPETRKLKSWKRLFLKTMQNVSSLLGDFAFRTFDEKGKRNRNINAALYDAQMIGVSNMKGEMPDIDQNDLKRMLMSLYEEDEFRQSIISGTSTSKSVRYRISRFEKFIHLLES